MPCCSSGAQTPVPPATPLFRIPTPRSAGSQQSNSRPQSGGSIPSRRQGTPPIPTREKRCKEALIRDSAAIIGYNEIERGTEDERREVKDLMYEHWNGIKKVRRNLDLCTNGYVPVAAFCKGAAQELSLRRDKDARILTSVILQCLQDDHEFRKHPLGSRNEGLVDLDALWLSVQPPKQGDKWKKRFRAVGVMPHQLQRHTIGVDTNTRTHYDGPPYAVCGDGDHMKILIKEYFQDRCRRMRTCLQRHGSPDRPGILTREEFKKAMLDVEKYGANERELEALVGVVDRRNTGYISINDFLERFGLEYLKGRSMRLSVGRDNNDGSCHTLQWPSSTGAEFKKSELMERLRTKQLKSRKVTSSRSSCLRRRHGRQQRIACEKFDRPFNEWDLPTKQIASRLQKKILTARPAPPSTRAVDVDPASLGNNSIGPSRSQIGRKNFQLASCLQVDSL